MPRSTTWPASFAREDEKPAAAGFLEDYADWLRDSLEDWAVTTKGDALPDFRRYFIRINTAKPGEADGPADCVTAKSKIR